MICEIEIEHGCFVTPGELELVRSHFPEARLSVPTDQWVHCDEKTGPDEKLRLQQERFDKEDVRGVTTRLYTGGETRGPVDMEAFLEQCPFVPFKVRKRVRLKGETVQLTQAHLAVDLTRLERVGKRLARLFNDKCHVHVGGSLLLEINQVEVLNDACTTALQERLDQGWRIVACCVQPDGRRPDYVLGRKVEEKNG